MKYSYSLLLAFSTKLVCVPGSQERGTQAGAGFPRTGNPHMIPGSRVLGNPEPDRIPRSGKPEPILNFCEKIVIAYFNIPLCFKMRKNGL